MLKIFATLVSGISRVLWYAFKGMGFGVHEGPSARQSKGKPSNNCSGEKKKTDCLCCYSGTWPLLFRELIKLKIYLLLGCKRILGAIGSGSMYETLWAVQVIWRPLLLPWFLSELKVSFLCYLMICLLFSSHGICIFYYKSNCIINIPKKQGHNFISLIMGYVELKEDLR